MSPLIERLLAHGRPADVALEEDDGRGALRAIRYGELRRRAEEISVAIRGGRRSLAGAPVAFLAAPSSAYVEALMGILLAGGMAVPLSPMHTQPELERLLRDAEPVAVLVSRALAERAPALPGSTPLAVIEDLESARAFATAGVSPADPALMLYTSGTTGRPKGVVLSHAAVAATCAALEVAWGWRRDDRLLHVLPLHHTHGVIVALLGGLWAGAAVRFTGFDPPRVWRLLEQATVFMAVPTMYAKLVAWLRAAPDAERAGVTAGAARLRLATSGSAALPAPLLEEFRAATGQTILERYGMTEIGMALSNPLSGPRVPGAVGRPLPGVLVDIVGDHGRSCAPGEPGELRVRSPQVFSGYHRDPETTAAAFDLEGRFRTGDTGQRDEAGVVRLLGRTSTDIIKSGGYKLSALEIEQVLREHQAIADVAVIGAPDETWGERVTACVVLAAGHTLSLDELRTWARERLAPYKSPRDLLLLESLPRNAMGKVQKPELKKAVLSPR